MTVEKTPTRRPPPFGLRLPETLLADVDAFAKQAGKSRHAAILELLQIGVDAECMGIAPIVPLPVSKPRGMKKPPAKPAGNTTSAMSRWGIEVPGPQPVAYGARLKGAVKKGKR